MGLVCSGSIGEATADCGPLNGFERKTGVKHAELITVQLVQDERGWLRLAG
jgi:hypothetical protein